MADQLSLSLETMGINLPYNMQAEQAVIGAVIINNETVSEIVEALRPEYFYSKQNGAIFEEIVNLFFASTPVDFITLLSKVEDAGIFNTEEEAKVYLTTLAETVPSLSNINSYIDIIKEKYLIRKLMDAAKDILEKSGDGTSAQLQLEAAEQKIYEIRRGQDRSEMQPVSSVLLDTLAHLQKVSGPDREKYLGIPTGFTYLDKVITGLGRSDLIILAARPGMGKTAFALNIATNVAKKQKVPVAIFSLEMTKDQLVTRILSSEAGVNSQSLRTGSLTGDDWDDLAYASEQLSSSPIYLDDTSNITMAEIKAKIRRINQDPAKPDIGLVIIDYLQLMNSGRKTDSRVQEISEITRSLKIMAKELNVPVICLSQLSRATERGSNNNHRPGLSDLRDSGSIEQDADVVLFLIREAYYQDNEDADTNKATCIVAKNRHGETADVSLGWDGEHTRFLNVENIEYGE